MSRLLATGRAGGIQAVNLADKYFESIGKDVVLVGAVDSFFDRVLLGKLDIEDRLSSDSVNGFVPGEGAGFLLLVSQRVISKLPVRHKAVLYLPGLAEEPGHRYAAEPYRGDVLANAFRSALKQSDGLPVKAIFSSMNGEHFWAKEMGVAMTRNQAAISEGARIEHPADCFWDIGAAIGPVLIGLMSMDKPASYLACCSSEQQARAAIVAQAVFIFSGDLARHLPLAISLTLMGDAILCLIVGIFSSYPGSIAVEQDAPAAIIAVVIASVLTLLPANTTSETKFATALMLVLFTTILTGIFFIILGYFKLGDLARYLPYPVMGGFLAGTGWLLVTGAISIVVENTDVANLIQPDVLRNWLPAFALALIVLVVGNRWNNPLILPALITISIRDASNING